MKLIIMAVLFLIISCGGSDEHSQEKKSIKISHRGYEENKISGFISAMDDGYKFIETDVRLRDGKAVLLHDDIECNNCELLEELIKVSESRGVTVFVEIKEIAAVKTSVDIVSKYNADVVFISFDQDTLRLISSISNYKLGWLTKSAENLKEIDSYIDWLLISKITPQSECVEYLLCGVWTIDSKEDFQLFDGKVDAIIMDKF